MSKKMTKAQLQQELIDTERRLKAAREEIDRLNRMCAVLKSTQLNELLDYPERTDQNRFSWYQHYEQRRAVALGVLRKVADWAARNIANSTVEDENERIAIGLGTMLCWLFDYCGTPILLTAAYGLEDANWHQEASVLFRMYDKDSKGDSVNGVLDEQAVAK